MTNGTACFWMSPFSSNVFCLFYKQKRIKALQLELERKKKEHDKLQEKVKNKLKKYELLSAEQAEILEKNKEMYKELTEVS